MPLSPLIAILAVASAATDVSRDLDRSQIAREEKLAGYTVTETYNLRNARFSDAAQMIVNVSYSKGAGKTFQVVSRRGPAFLQTSVLDRMLKEEGDLSRGEVRKNALVTSANYQMKPLGGQILDGRPCDVFELTPRKKSPHLLQGKAWVDAQTHNLIRIEGKPTASVSFWAGTPQVVREYAQIGEFSFARRTEAVSQSFLLGRSDLTIDYTGYRIGQSEVETNKDTTHK